MTKTATAAKFFPSQRVEVLVPDFKTPGFPLTWKPATVTAVTLRDCGKLLDVSITRDDGAFAHQIVGPRSGNSKVRAL